MACRILCFITDKLLKTLYTLLLIVLMVLWIVISVEAGRQLQELHHRTAASNGRLKPEDARRLPGSLASAALLSASKTSISRLYALTIFNTLLEEFIALGALLSLFLGARRLFSITLILLIIIWFIEQYRISDFYHQIDHLDYQSSQMIIATHVIHFLVILLGIGLRVGVEFFEAAPDGANKASSSADIEKPAKVASANAFASLERHISTATSDNSTLAGGCSSGDEAGGLVKKARCAWMRSTFIKRKEGQKGGRRGLRGGTSGGRDRRMSKSNVTVISIEPDEEEMNGHGHGGQHIEETK